MSLVKICGLSEPVTMNAALDAGADMVGLVFYEKSPRHVSLSTAQTLTALARGRAKIVALIVDASDDRIAEIAAVVNPDYIQAHGKETPERIADIEALTGIPVYKALPVATEADVARARDYAACPFILYDAKPSAGALLPGGNGLAFDWTILEHAAHPFMLAGGLTPTNVAEAIRVTGAAMVDVSSGVESAPGVKDISRIRKFIEAAKAAG